MILHPGILALLCCNTLVLLMLLHACALAVIILRHWDFTSSSEAQLQLERKTYLASTLVHYALGLEALSLLLFIFTVDEIHPLFVGAMCATGVLNAAPLGWWALMVKIGVFFAASFWVGLNYLDAQAEDAPLTRIKFFALLPLAPLVATGLYLQTAYFLALQPEVITSCCGSLFSAAGTGVAADLAALPARPMIAGFFGAALLVLASALACLKWTAAWLRYLLALLAASFFPLALTAIVAFVSLYIYQLPTHHCPFDMFQGQYNFIGYPLYLGLFGSTLFGILPGVFQSFSSISTLRPALAGIERKWLGLAIGMLVLLVLLASWPMVFGNFRLMTESAIPFRPIP